MPESEESRYVRAELETIRRELAAMRDEQRQLAQSLEQLMQTFRNLAIHMGIGAEPYRKREDTDRQRELPGFA
ncbi:MAG TPA: hypothetical protein VGV89_01865 [Thermoplasmata archaeon]|nr:hypothetical protein [Thermoplasmata archaeon]